MTKEENILVLKEGLKGNSMGLKITSKSLALEVDFLFKIEKVLAQYNT